MSVRYYEYLGKYSSYTSRNVADENARVHVFREMDELEYTKGEA